MKREFLLPALGENISTAKVVSVLVKPGDRVKIDQPVLEIETDKASLEVPADANGLVKEVLVKEGGTAQVGAPILIIEAEEGAGSGAGAKAAPAPAAITRAATPLPKRTAAAAPSAAPAAPALPSTPPQAAPALGAVSATASSIEPEFDTPLGNPIGAELVMPSASSAGTTSSSAAATASPSVRRFAREIGVDIAKVAGTGPGGRITQEDIKTYAKRMAAQRQAAGGAGAPPPPQIIGETPADFARHGEIESIPLSNVRRIIAERLAYSWATIPHVHQHDSADITELEAMRRAHNERVRPGMPKLTVTAVILKTLAALLKKYPKFNASLSQNGAELIYKKYINIGVAADTDRGLLVPVLRGVDQKSILDIALEVEGLSARAREGKIAPDEMKGGTFTVTNLGGIGGTSFNPIINPPEVAILAVARASLAPTVLADGTIAPRLILPLCLAYDHRVIDGADGARFLRELAVMLSSPAELIWNL